MQLTSFKGRSVHKRFPRQPKMRAEYIPIHPRQQIVPNGIQLHLANGVVLMKHSYVNISKIYTVHISMLRRYNWDFPANHYQLGKQSVKDVLHCIHQQHPDQAITADIVTSTVVPSTIATHRQASMGSSIGSTRHYIAINIDRLVFREPPYLSSRGTSRSCVFCLCPTYKSPTQLWPFPNSPSIQLKLWTGHPHHRPTKAPLTERL